MAERVILQNGGKSIYIERQDGDIYIGDYVEEVISAFREGSYVYTRRRYRQEYLIKD